MRETTKGILIGAVGMFILCAILSGVGIMIYGKYAPIYQEASKIYSPEIAKDNSDKLEVTMAKNQVTLNGKDYIARDGLGNVAKLIEYNGTVYAPITAIAKDSGANVVVYSDSGKISISTKATEVAKTESKLTKEEVSEVVSSVLGNPTNEKINADDDGYLEAGNYKVGTDISAGEYYIEASGSCYYEVSKDSSGKSSSIIANGNTDTFTYITVSDGQYLEISNGKFIFSTKSPIPEPTNGMLRSGMYKVGKDIKPGEYNVISDIGESCYVEISKDSSGKSSSIISNKNFDKNYYVKVSNGQYLQIERGYIRTEPKK